MLDDADEHSECLFPLQDIFKEPPRPPSPQATFTKYLRELPHKHSPHNPDSRSLPPVVTIRLVGSHPLWGHHLWNAAIALASHLDLHRDLVQDKFVLELGAGGGLPGIVAAQLGAAKVVLSDYPDPDLLDNLTFNVAQNIPADDKADVDVQGYIWGRDVDVLLDVLPPPRVPPLEQERGGKFDLIILSDLIFNHSQHDALLSTCEACLACPSKSPDAPASPNMSPCPLPNRYSSPPSLLVFYTHHRPHLAQRDLVFFDRARARGWTCEKILSRRFPPMFPDDPGDEDVRASVHGWRLTRTVEGVKVDS